MEKLDFLKEYINTCGRYKEKALHFAEVAGIIEYKVNNNIMTYIISYPGEQVTMLYKVDLDTVEYTTILKHDLTFGAYEVERIKSADIEQVQLDNYLKCYTGSYNGLITNAI